MKDTDIIAAIAPDAVSLMDKAIAEIKRLRQENATLTAERDALFVLTDRLTAEHDALRAELRTYTGDGHNTNGEPCTQNTPS